MKCVKCGLLEADEEGMAAFEAFYGAEQSIDGFEFAEPPVWPFCACEHPSFQHGGVLLEDWDNGDVEEFARNVGANHQAGFTSVELLLVITWIFSVIAIIGGGLYLGYFITEALRKYIGG